jgi:hypothetical protein
MAAVAAPVSAYRGSTYQYEISKMKAQWASMKNAAMA